MPKWVKVGVGRGDGGGYSLNLQPVLFRPLRSHQCTSEWFENRDMSIAQLSINTSHTNKQ